MISQRPRLLHLFGLLLFLYGVIIGNSYGQTISIGAFTPTSCQGSALNISIPVTKTGTFPSNNQFRAELSQPGPGFGYNPASALSGNVNISGTTGFIPFQIPSNIPAGQYRIRVFHLASQITSNEANFSVAPPYVATMSLRNRRCNADTIIYDLNLGPSPFYTVLSLNSATKRWYRNNQLITGQTGNTLRILPGQYKPGDVIKAEVRTNSGCFGGGSAPFVSTANDTIEGIGLDSLSSRFVCAGQTLNLNWSTFKVPAGGTYTILLSDTLGSFTNPLVSQPATSMTSSSFTLPANLISKPTYRYRIKLIYGPFTGALCPESNFISINVGSAVATAALNTVSDTLCAGSNWQLTATTSGLINPLYSWSLNGNPLTGSASSNTVVTPANNDSVTVSISGLTGCGPRTIVVTRKVTVKQIPAIPVVANDSICGQGDVILQATNVPSGTTIRWYDSNNLLLGTGNTFRTNSFTTPGQYTYLVRGFNGTCEGQPKVTTVDVFQLPAKPSIAGFSQLDTLLCDGEVIQLIAPSGYNGYRWSNGSSGQQLTVSAAGKYAVQVENNGCFSPASDTVVVRYRPSLVQPVVRQVNIPCDTGQTTLTVQNATTGQNYTWVNMATGQTLGFGTSVLVGLSARTVVGIQTTAGRCTSPVVQVGTTINPLPQKPVIAATAVQLCDGNSVQLTGPVGFVSYTWSNGLRGQTISVNSPGKYSLIVSNGICNSLPSDSINITGSGIPPVFAGRDTTISLQDGPVQIFGYPLNQGVWSGPSVNAAGYFSPEVSGIGQFSLTYTVTNGRCQNSDDVVIRVIEGAINLINIFTPNQDGQNDSWEPTSLIYRYNPSVHIYNRYGTLVHEINAMNQPWDGIAAGAKVPAGTYYYQMTFPDGRKFTGPLQIMW